jgi:uncharacterized phage-associated protein
MFNEIKVAQMAAFFINKEVAGVQNIMKLMKLLYLSDRESLRRYNEPITDDRMVSMDYGPVLSNTLSYINGYPYMKWDQKSNVYVTLSHGWESWITAREQHQVSLTKKISINDLDELSEADLDVLESVWKDFGHMSQWDLSNYTHTSCPEWKDPNGSTIVINYSDIFCALGKDPILAKELEADILDQHKVSELFDRL